MQLLSYVVSKLSELNSLVNNATRGKISFTMLKAATLVFTTCLVGNQVAMTVWRKTLQAIQTKRKPQVIKVALIYLEVLSLLADV
jgi:hypothetical protein